ncbi:hypothetical protein TNCV_3076981 [Trichonephila clavipes]|nr:hypothetical protein TNCV_3076981 [Trichonephila clavipes]
MLSGRVVQKIVRRHLQITELVSGGPRKRMRETSPAVLMAEATIPVTTPIKEEKWNGRFKGCLRQGQGHGVVARLSKNLVNDMLICSSDYEVLIENSQNDSRTCETSRTFKERRNY